MNFPNRIIITERSKSLTLNRIFDFKTECSTSSITITDLHKGGYLDIVEATLEQQNYVYLSLEDGEYIEIGLPEDLKDDNYIGLGYITVSDLKT